MEKKIKWNTLMDENVCLKITYLNRIKKNTNLHNKKSNDILKNEKIDYTIDNPEVIKKIDKITNITKLDKMTSLELLEKQEFITNYLSRYFIQNTKLNYNFVLTNVAWLIKVSSILAKRINQKITNVKSKKKNNNVSRSSYKFCIHNSQCEFNYGTKKKSCNSDHYVHSNVYTDLSSLQQYIQTKTITNECFESNREITKCINTIAYVVRHMYDELRNVCLYQNKENYEKVHFNNYNKTKHHNYTKKKNKRFNKSV